MVNIGFGSGEAAGFEGGQNGGRHGGEGVDDGGIFAKLIDVVDAADESGDAELAGIELMVVSSRAGVDFAIGLRRHPPSSGRGNSYSNFCLNPRERKSMILRHVVQKRNGRN